MDERTWYWVGLFSTFIDTLLLSGLVFFPWKRLKDGQQNEIKGIKAVFAGGIVGIIFLLKAYMMIVEYQVNFLD